MEQCLLPSLPIVNRNTRLCAAQPKLLRWKQPFLGYVAVNCDGSFRERNNTCGYGIIVRDCFGRFIVAKANHFQKADLIKDETIKVKYGTTVLMIEMLAIRDGLRLAKGLELTHVEIQSDSKVAISILVGESRCPSQCLGVLSDIRSEISFFKGLGFIFVYRERNRAADFLSKCLTSDGERCFDSSDVPHALQKIIVEDALGFLTPRF
ncbi:hypothetical protein DH2020_010902 [Rehmannia glutinosa]|uniref:RNase H type-1 domain-containing protein n=1 Tax=Rehmannia glutinosa TaxID=99300 RepID=A0ABR0XBW7_REHGL